MADRRTTVVLDVQIGDIYLPQGRLRIPAEIEPSVNEAQAESLADKIRKALTPLIGQAFAEAVVVGFARIITYAESMANAIFSAMKAMAALAAAVLALVLIIKYLAWWLKTMTELFQRVGDVLKKLWEWFIKINKAMIEFIAVPFKAALEGSAKAMTWLVDASIEAGKAVYELAVTSLREASRAGAEFEQQVANTVTVLGLFGEAGDVARGIIGDLAMAMTRGTGAMPLEAVRAMWDVASAGFTEMNDLAYVSQAAIALSNASLESLGNTVQLVTSVIRQYTLGTDQAARVSNALAAASIASTTDIRKLMESMKYAGPVAAGFGLSVERTLAILGVFANQGILASNAGTALRAVFAALSRTAENKEGLAYFKEFGIDLNELNITSHELPDVIARLSALQKQIGKGRFAQLLSSSFGMREFSGLLALVNQGADALVEMEDKIAGTNSAYMMQAEQLRTLQGAWKILMNLWASAQIVISRGINPVLVTAVQWLQRMVDAASELGIFERFGQVGGQAVEAILGPLSELGDDALNTVSMVIELVSQSIAQLRPALVSVLPVLQQFIQWLPYMVSDVLVMLVRFGTWFLTIGIPLFIRFAEAVGPRLVLIFDRIGEVVAGLLADGGDTLIRWFEQLLDFASGLVENLPWVASMLLEVADAMIGWAQTIAGIVNDTLPRLIPMVDELIGLAMRLIDDYLPLLSYIIGVILWQAEKLIYEIIPRLISAFENNFPDVLATIDKMGSLVDKLTTAFESMASFMQENGAIFAPIQKFLDFLVNNSAVIIRTLINMAKLTVIKETMKVWAQLVLTGNWSAAALAVKTQKDILDMLDQLQDAVPGKSGYVGPQDADQGGMTRKERAEQYREAARIAKQLGDKAAADRYRRKANDVELGRDGGQYERGSNPWGRYGSGGFIPPSERNVEGIVGRRRGAYTVVFQYTDLDSMQMAANAEMNRRKAQEQHMVQVNAANLLPSP